MESLQVLGLGAIIYVVYKFIYVPYISKKEEEKKDTEQKIGILSSSYRDMRELFQPHVKPVYETDEDGNEQLVKGWVKVFNRVLYFSSDSELNDFRTKASALYQHLRLNSKSRAEMEVIFKEHKDYVEKGDIEKATRYLELRKNLLDYRKTMSEVFLNSDNILESEVIIIKLSEKLQLSSIDSTKLFEKLSHNTTGIIFRSGKSKDGKSLYKYDESFISGKTINDIR
ncbi:MAG: hypothetical protein V4717_14555 [Bacteroidota bacterium]